MGNCCRKQKSINKTIDHNFGPGELLLQINLTAKDNLIEDDYKKINLLIEPISVLFHK